MFVCLHMYEYVIMCTYIKKQLTILTILIDRNAYVCFNTSGNKFSEMVASSEESNPYMYFSGISQTL